MNTRPRNDRGASLVEYAMLVALIAVISIGAAKAVGIEIFYLFYESGEHIAQAGIEPG